MEMRSIFRSMSQEEKNEWVGADEDDSTWTNQDISEVADLVSFASNNRD
jgi:hypothetical protein